MNKDQKVTLFRAIMKFVIVFLILTILGWLAWNLFVVGELGIGDVVRSEKIWIFGFPSFVLIYILYFLSPYWLIILKFSDFLIYSTVMFGWLGLIWWL